MINLWSTLNVNGIPDSLVSIRNLHSPTIAFGDVTMDTVSKLPCMDLTVADHEGSVAVVEVFRLALDEVNERPEKRPVRLFEDATRGTITSVFFE